MAITTKVFDLVVLLVLPPETGTWPFDSRTTVALSVASVRLPVLPGGFEDLDCCTVHSSLRETALNENESRVVLAALVFRWRGACKVHVFLRTE